MKEWTEIYEQMRGTFAQRAGFVPSEGCDSAVRLYALAAELQSLLMQADWVLDQSFPQTAQGMYLDYHAETRGITRAAAEKAEQERLAAEQARPSPWAANGPTCPRRLWRRARAAM